jgi:energy-coupling factor transporter ATP-binding protein EcfA2
MIDAFEQLKASGVTILLVEQNINFAQAPGRHVAVMDNGVVVHAGSHAGAGRGRGAAAPAAGTGAVNTDFSERRGRRGFAKVAKRKRFDSVAPARPTFAVETDLASAISARTLRPLRSKA